jgi:two-component system, OmpR family, response regulator ChvI
MDQLSVQPARGNILVVDDDALFRESLNTNLIDAGFSTVAVGDGNSAVQHLSSSPATDIVLLDWKMPGMSGIEVLQKLRLEKIDIPVIFLTVLSDQIYEEVGLLGGAVDFIEKSRSFSILLRRIELILSGSKSKLAPQSPQERKTELAKFGKLTLRYDSRRATWNHVNVGLTLTEFNIVAYLTEYADRDVSYREIYDIVHGEGFVAGDGEAGYRTNVRAFIKRIRQKFRDIDPAFSEIKNYPSFGYRWQSGPEH